MFAKSDWCGDTCYFWLVVFPFFLALACVKFSQSVFYNQDLCLNYCKDRDSI